jgi:hypothetical protein
MRYSKRIDQKALAAASVEKRERAEKDRLKTKTAALKNDEAK